MAAEVYIGLMSGTSLDGLDGVLVEFEDRQADGLGLRVLAEAHRAYDPALRTELLSLNTSGTDEIHRAALAGNAVARLAAEVVAEVCRLAPAEATARVVAIGSHGQTVRHRPGEFDGLGYTVQLDNPALLAELTGLDVIADLRRRDVAAGGQGAPLVPAFHRAIFGRPGETVALLNIGGIANLSLLWADGRTTGFDCGPGNLLMDHWAERHLGTPYDDGGRWAASGRVDDRLLAALKADPYFAAAPPKSTGRDHFHAAWLQSRLAGLLPAPVPDDVQATLAELTATVCADDLSRQAPAVSELLVCGGGARNGHLMRRLADRLPGVRVMPTEERGLPAQQVEACAFAWLARAFSHRQPGNLASVTGARGPRPLGALHPAGG